MSRRNVRWVKANLGGRVRMNAPGGLTSASLTFPPESFRANGDLVTIADHPALERVAHWLAKHPHAAGDLEICLTVAQRDATAARTALWKTFGSEAHRARLAAVATLEAHVETLESLYLALTGEPHVPTR